MIATRFSVWNDVFLFLFLCVPSTEYGYRNVQFDKYFVLVKIGIWMNVGTAIPLHAIPKQSKRKSVNVVELFTEQMRVIRRNRKDKSASGRARPIRNWRREKKNQPNKQTKIETFNTETTTNNTHALEIPAIIQNLISRNVLILLVVFCFDLLFFML